MRKKKWVKPFLENEERYLLKDFSDVHTGKPINVEIGMGMGDFITEAAAADPDTFYIGLEKEETCVGRAIRKAEEKELGNLRIMFENAERIDEIFPEGSIDLIYLHFSDPWPKKRTHKRRLTYPTFLERYRKILKDKGIIILKTDNESFYDDSLGYFETAGMKLLESSRDYYVEGEPMTAYQRRFVSLGQPIYYAKYVVDKV